MTQATDLTFATRRAGDVRLIAGVSAAHFVSHYYYFTLPPLFAFVRAEYDVSYKEIGLVLTAFSLASAVFQTPAGFLVDRVNARLVLAAGLLCGATGLAAAASINSFWVLVAMFGLVGLGNTVYHPADYALLSRHVAPERLSQAFSIHTFMGMLGSAAGPASMLFMYSLWGWRGAFMGAAVLGFAIAAWILIMGDPPAQPVAKPREGTDKPDDNSWRLLMTPAILINAAFFTLLAFGSFGLQSFGVVALGALHGTSPTVANTGLTGHLLMSAAGVLLGGWIAARFPQHVLMTVLGLAGTAIALLVTGVVDLPTTLLILVMSLSGLTLGITFPARDLIIRKVTPPGSFGKVFAFVTNGFHIAGIIAPLLFGALMDSGEPRLVIFLTAGFWLLGAAAVASVPGRRPA